MKHINSLLKKVGKGQGGFTLIELLIVIVILGVIAAVVVLNIGGFLGAGTEEAANTEAHQVQTAVIAYLSEHNLTDFDGSVGPGGYTSPAPQDYITNPGTLQATYYFEDAELKGADPKEDGKWASCNFTAGVWHCPD